MTPFEKEKTQKIELVHKLHKELSELVLYNGVKKEVWDGLVHELMGVRSSKIQVILDWLVDFKATTHAEMLHVWNQQNMTPEMWYNYKVLFDSPVLIEQKQMHELKKKLKIKWRALGEKLKRREQDGAAEHTEQETS